ncbi:MAG: hypothetical protein ABIG28_00720 [archaeon]
MGDIATMREIVGDMRYQMRTGGIPEHLSSDLDRLNDEINETERLLIA